MDPATILLINALSDVILKGLIALQNISGKSEEEVLAAIKDESTKTDELLLILKE